MTTTKDRRWGNLVAVLFGSFVIFILTCVGFASFQRFDLVDQEYYEKGIAHQSQLDQMNRVSALPSAPIIDYSAQSKEIVITFPQHFPPSGVSGTVTLFRPSNAAYDRTVALSLRENGEQTILMQGFPVGKWKVQLAWQYRSVSYFQEELIVSE